MASVRSRDGVWWLAVRVGGRQFQRSLKTRDEREARRLKGVVERAALDLARGRLALPAGVDVVDYLLSDGRLASPVVAPAAPAGPPTLGQLWDAYEAAQLGQREPNTLRTHRLHRRNVAVLGEATAAAALTAEQLQAYIARRVRPVAAGGDGVLGVTARKELTTLKMVLTGSARQTGRRPADVKELFAGLVYPKRTGDPDHFLTWAEIEARAGGPDDPLWGRLFLTSAEVAQLLDWADAAPNFQAVPYLPPLLTAAAHTGARLAELTRSRVEDWDLAAGAVVLREKKRSRAGDTFRRVPVSPRLSRAMRAWLGGGHPGGGLAFGRHRDRRLSSNRACDTLRLFLRGSRWAVLPGYHCLRHSFASNLAIAGVDGRVIDELMGHQTLAMRKRYQHFTPAQTADAVRRLFGT